MKVVTRFAPSPTGFLHLGGARTAMFNYLFARHHGGEYKLRIEDTDLERNTPEALAAIFEGLSWLGIPHDGDAVFQSQRADRHRAVAYALVEAGAAYRDYTTPEQMDIYRLDWSVSGNKGPFRYDSPFRYAPARGPDTIPYTIRIKAPREGETTIDDLVQGRVTVQNREIDDFILLRSDGTPTYMLAVVVDDHDMGVTHVIRGDDHLNNAFRQLQIIRAMRWDEPAYAHIPLIHGSDGQKFSKRHGAVGVMEYADRGFVPDAMFNYLLRLGWGHGDDEIISRDQAEQWFDLDAVNRAPSRFDENKLLSLNAHYLRAMRDDALVEMLYPLLNDGDQSAEMIHDIILKVIPSLKPRAKTIVEMADMARFYIVRPQVTVDYDFTSVLASFPEVWERAAIEQALRDFADQNGVKLKEIVAPLRLAITGSTVSPPLFEAMEILGRGEVLSRIMAAS